MFQGIMIAWHDMCGCVPFGVRGLKTIGWVSTSSCGQGWMSTCACMFGWVAVLNVCFLFELCCAWSWDTIAIISHNTACTHTRTRTLTCYVMPTCHAHSHVMSCQHVMRCHAHVMFMPCQCPPITECSTQLLFDCVCCVCPLFLWKPCAYTML